MRLGALIITTGLQENAGIASLLESTGAVSAGQRMITAFRCCGVSCVGLVVEKGNKKQQRLFAQDGVLFFHADTPELSTLQGAQLGLGYLADKFDRIFLILGNRSLFLPETLQRLLESDADIVVPRYADMNGCPVLLTNPAVKQLLKQREAASLEEAVSSLPGSREWIPVEDAGTIIHSFENKHRKLLVKRQAKQLLRPATDVKIQIGNLYFDGKLAMLLHLIDETGSVRSASELMQTSYSTAWAMLNEADSTLDVPLILRKRGGSEGSGCALSQQGRAFLKTYDQYCEAISKKANTLYREMFRNLLE